MYRCAKLATCGWPGPFGSEKKPRVPFWRPLVACGLRGWGYSSLIAYQPSTPMADAEKHASFAHLPIGTSAHPPTLYSTVLHMKSFLSAKDCQTLREAADSHVAAVRAAHVLKTGSAPTHPTPRMRCSLRSLQGSYISPRHRTT